MKNDIAFTELSFQPFSGKFVTIIVQYPKPKKTCAQLSSKQISKT